MARTVQASAADLTFFHVADRETGNALLAWRLGRASDINDPWLTDFTTITIPTGPSPPGDGLPPY